MKKILVLSAGLICTAFVTSLFAQNPAISTKYSNKEIATFLLNYKHTHHRNVLPEGVLLQKFQQDFPNAHDVEWESNGGIYEVEFEIKFRDFEAFYDKDGNLVMYKQELRERNLPAVVKTAAEAKYPKYRFEDIEKIVKGTETIYKIEMEMDFRDNEVTMFITNEGKFISEKIDY
jgi:hypothetical protein